MLTIKMRQEAKNFLIENWGDSGKKVIEACGRATPLNGTFSEFLNHCTACGGNWGGMLLSGVRELWPEVWEAIPEQMGAFAFTAICETLILCGVDTTE